MGFPLPGISSSFRIRPLPQHCSELPFSKASPPQEHPQVSPSPSLCSGPRSCLCPIPPGSSSPWSPPLGVFSSWVLLSIITWTPPITYPKSPALVAVLSLMSLIRVNRVSSLPCCDVSNLSALILASCLSTSTCLSLSRHSSFFPNAFTIISHSFCGFLLSPYRSVFHSVVSFSMSVFVPDRVSLCVFLCLSPSVSLFPLFSCFLLPSCWLPQSSTARTVIPLPIPLAVLRCHAPLLTPIAPSTWGLRIWDIQGGRNPSVGHRVGGKS